MSTTNNTDLSIYDIEGWSADFIANLDGEHINVKGHDVCLIDLGGRWGYSALVCADGKHIKYANEYELHYPHYKDRGRDALRKRYIELLNEKLFTEDEIVQPSDDYNERQAKVGYLVNYYSYRRDCWHFIGERPSWYGDHVTCCPGCYVMYRKEDSDFARHIQDLYDAFSVANDPLRDYEHAYKAFLYEMYNHEYAISWQGDWEVIRCFANVDGYSADDMLQKTGWSDEIKRAYRDASRKAMNVEY
jgi:hypothetical protein